jgi:methionyl-tRNA formyltransferase
MAARAVESYLQLLEALGHETVGVLTLRNSRRPQMVPDTIAATPTGIDAVVVGSKERVAPLLRSFSPDVALCSGFGWKLDAEALAVPPLGIVNGHPSLLPRYRGPNPIGWALRNGDRELGFTFHRMDADFDTGRVLAQGTAPLVDAERAEDVLETLFVVATSLLPRALERVEAGDPGDAQVEEDASYAGFFEPEYAELDWTRPVVEVHRQVRAWWVAASRDGVRGPLAELGGERVYVRRTRLDAAEGGTRVECGDGPIWVLETAPAPVVPAA